MRMIVSLIALLFIAAPVWAMESEKHEEKSKIHWHGYGEIHYNDPTGSSNFPDNTASSTLDAHRLVWGLSVSYTHLTLPTTPYV